MRAAAAAALDAAGAAEELRALEARALARMGGAGGGAEEGDAAGGDGWDVVLQLAGAVRLALPNATAAAAER